MLAYTTPARGEVIPARRGVGCLFREWVFGDTSVKMSRMFAYAFFILNSFEGGQDDVAGMKIKCIICIVFLVFFDGSRRYDTSAERSGRVCNFCRIEKVYIDLAAGTVKPGDKVAVYSKEGYFIHPVTKKRLKREPSQVASLEVVKVYTDYSLAKAVPAQSLSKVEVGMSVQCNAMSQSSHSESSSDVYGPPAAKENRPSVLSVDPVRTTDEKVSVFVAPAQVNDVVGVGYFGTYVSDLLMEQLMFCDKVRLLICTR